MGLTSSVPNSILQPGVCTSSTRPASPYHGQVVFETDTQKTLFYNGTSWVILNDPNAVSIDASGNVTFDNDVTVTGTITSVGNPQGLVLVKSQDVVGTPASITLTNVFTNEFLNYRIVYKLNSSVNTGVGMTINGASGSTDYDFKALFFFTYVAGQWNESASFGTSLWRVGWIGSSGLGGATIDIYSPNVSTQTHYFSNFASYVSGVCGGRTVSTSVVSTDFTLSPSSGTLTGGRVSVYGYNDG